MHGHTSGKKGTDLFSPKSPYATPTETSQTLNEKALQVQGFSDLERAKGIEPSS